MDMNPSFTVPEPGAARIAAEVSALAPMSLGKAGRSPLIVALQTLSLSRRTMADCLGVNEGLISRWCRGWWPIPAFRQDQLRELLEVAIQHTEAAIGEIQDLPEAPDKQRLIGVLRGRIAAARAALAENVEAGGASERLGVSTKRSPCA
jgi:hypothetical protein